MSRLILDRLRSSHASRVALVQDGRKLTYTDLDAWSSSLAGRQLRTIAEEEPVGLLAPSGFEFVVGLCAIWKTNRIAVPLQPAHPPAELRYILEDTGMKRMLVHPNLMNLAREITSGVTNLQLIEIDPTTGGEWVTPPANPRQGALIIYTSGTTNRPKGVVSTTMSLDAQISSLLEAWRWTENDRALDVLPLHHVHGLVMILCSGLAAGASVELAEKFDADTTCARIESGAVDVFMAVPTVYTKLIQHWRKMSDERKQHFGRKARALRLMVSGSAALPKPVFEEWLAITGHALLERYGMTELGIALSNPYEGPRKPLTVGRPVPRVEVRLSSEGELQVKGPNVFREYWRKPEATRESFTSDGWFLTGDIAEVEDGYYKILGRRSQDIVKSGGYKISALEIESVLLEHPRLKEVAVFGVPDDEWGERIACAFVAEKNVVFSELEEFLKDRLARYKIPSRWKSFETLPRNAMGKVVKRDLKKLFEPS
jgi:malonyl-CoA/methylmalonyl-CoA synthetase